MTLSPSSMAGRLSAQAEAHRLLIEALALAGGVGIFLVSVLPNLANHPVLTDDEIWVYSAAYKLAHQGVFGSDMFAGFFHADQHYFFNMPLHHFVLAGALKLLGAGILQARLVGVAYGLATIGLAYLLARRLYGAWVAILALGLLLFLRLNIGFDTGLPLQEAAANLRYDLAPVPLLLGAALVLQGGSTWRRAVVAGALCGLATLMQFYGAFFLPIAAAFFWLEALPRAERLRLIGWLLAAAALVGLPYGIFALSNRTDFRGQVGITAEQRSGFEEPRFYIDNLLHEPDRFLRPLAFKEVPRGADPDLVDPRWLSLQETLTRRPSAKLAVLVGLPLALIYSGWRARKLNSRNDRLLFLALAGLVLQYTLFESTKFYIYWIAVLPFLCIGIAAGALALLQSPPRLAGLRWPVPALVVILLLLVFAEGSSARLGGLRTAPDAASYNGLAHVLQEQVPDGSRVVGSTSLWWALHDTDYRSYFLFFYVTRPDAGPYRSTITQWLDDFRPQYLVLTRLAQNELQKHLSPKDYAELQAYLDSHAQKQPRVEGPEVANSYGYVDIWRFGP